MKPLVGITAHRSRVAEGERFTIHDVVGAPYIKAVSRAGGIPVGVSVVDPSDLDAVAELVARFDAIVITGGPDVDPSRYGRPTEPVCGPTDPERDARDLAIASACLAADHPTLAICRGVQVLNVAAGGTLVQHIDDHMIVDRYNGRVHGLRIEPGSVLSGILGESYWSNSLHHQCIDDPAPGARVGAWADDGTIEAIEIEQAPNVLGVQWHPEMLRHDPGHLRLFEHVLSLRR